MMKHYLSHKSCTTGNPFFILILVILGLMLTGCSTSSTFTPTGNPLLDLRNPELLERDRIAAAELAWGEVESGVRVRERTRKALKNLAWSDSTTPNLRIAALSLLMSDESEEGSQDSRDMARLLLPTERSPDAVRVLADRAVKNGWDELVPALVRSYARVSPNVPDVDRDERKALESLRPGMEIERIVFEVFLRPTVGTEDVREQAVLRLSQRTRDDAWGLLARLDQSGDLRRQFIQSSLNTDVEEESRVLVGDLRAAMNELGVLPNSALEIQWLSNLRRHTDSRNQRLNEIWWNQVSQVISRLNSNQREGVTLRHLEAIRWADVNRPAWLSLDRDSLYGVVSERMSTRVHHKRKHQKGEPRRMERVNDWKNELQWVDLLTILVVDDSLKNPVVVDQIFRQRTLDKKDTSTEYGGVIEVDGDTGFRAVLYRPRSRDRIDDKRFVASGDMFLFSDRSLTHYHFHVNNRNNTQYAGPSAADLFHTNQAGRTSLVFTSLGKHELNVDLYQPNGVVVDLGQLVEPE
ncbi:MAG: hypothetical protein P1U42_08390 [Phycisphaerales bacterium]|nr:hypothetical protein [Phycisphaerales bacterium]